MQGIRACSGFIIMFYSKKINYEISLSKRAEYLSMNSLPITYDGFSLGSAVLFFFLLRGSWLNETEILSHLSIICS